MAAPTLGLALIAKDEEANLPHLLASAAGAFDQVALLDTGSSDRTVEVFEEWAAGEQLPLGHRVGSFEWCDDFAAARNAADELLSTDWLGFADCDDVIRGARALREAVAHVPAPVQGLAFAYRMSIPGAPLAEIYRPRMHRRSGPAWEGRVHECRPLSAVELAEDILRVRPEVAYWQTSRHGQREESRLRNAAILRKWIEAEPDNPRPLGMLAAQSYVCGDRREGLALFSRHLELRRPRLSLDQLELLAWALAQLHILAALGPEEAVAFGPGFISILLGRPPEIWQSAHAGPIDA